jgi:hypothetical protein
MGRIGSLTPWDTKTRGCPTTSNGAMKPGEKATMLENRSPLLTPSERA